MFTQSASLHWNQRCEDDKLGALGIGLNTLKYILGSMFLHFIATDGRESMPHTGKKQAQVFVDLCGSANGRAGISTYHLLLDSDGGRNALDIVALWLIHSSEKLAGV